MQGKDISIYESLFALKQTKAEINARQSTVKMQLSGKYKCGCLTNYNQGERQ
jgi:hypothetical protein